MLSGRGRGRGRSHVPDLLDELLDLGVQVRVNGDDLLLRSREGVLTPELLERTRKAKPELMERLRSVPKVAVPACAAARNLLGPPGLQLIAACVWPPNEKPQERAVRGGGGEATQARGRAPRATHRVAR